MIRRFWATALTIVAAFWIVALAGLPVYVFPQVDEVPKSEAVFVLGPPSDAPSRGSAGGPTDPGEGS